MNVTFDFADLQPLIQEVVRTTLAASEADRAKLDADRLAYPEVEAAALLGVKSHILRDARHRGELTGVKIGKRVCYTRVQLLAFLSRQGDQQ